MIQICARQWILTRFYDSIEKLLCEISAFLYYRFHFSVIYSEYN